MLPLLLSALGLQLPVPGQQAVVHAQPAAHATLAAATRAAPSDLLFPAASSLLADGAPPAEAARATPFGLPSFDPSALGAPRIDTGELERSLKQAAPVLQRDLERREEAARL